MPVIVADCCAVNLLSVSADTSVFIGLYPKNAANRLPTGGAPAIWFAVALGTPLAMRPADIVVGSADERPTTINEKNSPIDNTIPVF